ncbi:hypothetical protein Hypma_000353 [Hypsizygus marmoreus]|uniref:FHA domain-containing protein n=1 Tax=Hypsizygus marmoreus TaxID=39966 RepID=A0A369JD87_HYPMA|nr:hypothetical protein Hypma_000353 [Hypsizygus marmoreus]
MSFMTTPMLNLSPVSGSFSFQAKYIPLSRDNIVVLGSEVSDESEESRTAAPTNGWFAPKRPIQINGIVGGSAPPAISPLPLSSRHSEVWWNGHHVYIHDKESPFGTYVNDAKITKPTMLKTGDIISLGSQIPRNSHTPGYITDEHLKPIIAKVTLVGVA